MIYLTADLHFGHANIIKYCSRPFKDVEEMDRILIKNINETVKEDDELYIVGDVSFYSINKTIALLQQINCKNIRLLQGNHDTNKFVKRFIRVIGRSYFKDEVAFIQTELARFVISHIPLEDNDNIKNILKNYIVIYLHGHLHTVGNKTVIKNYHYDVGVDNNNYKPIALSTIIEYIYK